MVTEGIGSETKEPQSSLRLGGETIELSDENEILWCEMMVVMKCLVKMGMFGYDLVSKCKATTVSLESGRS